MNYHSPDVALRLLRVLLLPSWDLRPRLMHAVALRLRTKNDQEKVAAKSETAIYRTAQAEPVLTLTRSQQYSYSGVAGTRTQA